MLIELALVGRSIPGRHHSDQRPLARSIVGWLTPCRNKPVAIITSTTPGAGNVGPSCSSQNFPCAPCVSRGRSVTPATVADHITPHQGDHQCSIGASCSPCANTVTAPARSSRKHTATNATSGLMAGPPIRTIRPTSHGLDLGAGRARGRCHLHRRPLFSFRWGRGGISENSEPARCRPPRSSHVRAIEKKIMLQ